MRVKRQVKIFDPSITRKSDPEVILQRRKEYKLRGWTVFGNTTNRSTMLFRWEEKEKKEESKFIVTGLSRFR